MSLPPGIALNGAVSQYDRWLRALDPGYAEVDGRSFSTLLDFAVQYAALIRYYDLSDEPDGDWVTFFLSDPTMILASIESFDLAAADAEYLALQRATAAERTYSRKFELLRATFRCIYDLAVRIQDWGQYGSAGMGELREPLRTLQSYDEGAGLPDALREPIGLDYSRFDLGCVCPDGTPYRGATRQRKIDHALPYLDPIFAALHDAITELKVHAATAMPATLATGNHKPQIALYIAFARLFGTAQETINTFSARYADFYYRRVLREPPAGPLPDSVYLTFTLKEEEGVDQTTVSGATLFPAGGDVLFEADHALSVTSAAIAALRTIRVAGDPLLLDAPSFITAAEVPLEAKEPWPTFGSVGDPLAQLGFSLATPYLLLSGGDRTVSIAFRFTDPLLDEKLQRLQEETGLDPQDIFTIVVHRAFTLQASTAEDWFDVGDYHVLYSGGNEFVINFQLPPTAPPLISFDGTAAPALRAWLRQEGVPLGSPPAAVVYPLTLLASMTIASVEVFTDVEGAADLRLENTDGEIDPTAPFTVFGGLPVVGSYLQIRTAELFSKLLETLKLRIEWFNLPQNDDGFQGWYRDYVIGLDGTYQRGLFDNRVFTGQLAVERPGSWGVIDPMPPRGQVYLFRTADDCLDPMPEPDGALCTSTLFNTLEVVGLRPPPFYQPLDSALRLTLAEPPYAFGNSLYAQNVLHAVIQDLPDPALCQEKCKEACAPLQRAALAIADCLKNPDSMPECLATVAAGLINAAKNCMQQCSASSPPDPLCDERCQVMIDCAACLDECLQVTSSPPEPLDECARNCMLRLEEAYASCMAACTAACLAPKKELHYPNDPYLPMAQSVRVDYTARSTPGSVAFTQLEPFGAAQPSSLPAPLLPQFPFEGALYADFSGAVSVAPLTLLVRTTSAELPSDDPPPVVWEIQNGDGTWARLDQERRLADTTNDLRNTGIVALSIPAGVQSLRASVARDAATFPDTAAITPHVMTATRQLKPGVEQDLSTPLPAGTISAAVQDLPYIASIDQPIASFGGRPAEDRKACEIRLGERLRHKDRAILAWDYERLVLDRFPTIWKTATLPPAKPGHVTVMVVAGSDGVDVADPTVPRAPAHVLARIRCFLETLSSPFVQLDVVNPVYVRITVKAAVEFSENADSGSNTDRLNDDLVRYLSPWYYDADRAAKGGRYASENEISEFIQTRPYVAALTALEFQYTPDPDSLEWYFLTSAVRHSITEVPPPLQTSCR